MALTNLSLPLLMALDPDKAAAMLAAQGIVPSGSAFDPGVGALESPADAGRTVPGAGNAKGAVQDATRALAAVQALQPQQAPRPQYVANASAPSSGRASSNPAQLAQALQLIMGAGQQPQNVPSLGSLIRGR